jgi:two-component system, NarL family, response regulator DesR
MELTPLTVLVGSEEPWLREQLHRGLEAAGSHVIADACGYDEVIDLALELRPDICLIDVDTGGGRGIDAASVITRVLDCTSCVLLADALSVGEVLESVQVGAAGCLPKDIDGARLAAALCAVAAGESAFPRRELREALGFLVPQVA